jgi:hypothetical protein
MTIHTLVFRLVTTCSLVDGYRRFGGMFSILKTEVKALKIEAICTSETLVIAYYTAACHKPEDNTSSHCCVNVL